MPSFSELGSEAAAETIEKTELPGTIEEDSLISPELQSHEVPTDEVWTPETTIKDAEGYKDDGTLIDPHEETSSYEEKWRGPEVLLDDNDKPYRKGDDLLSNNTYEMNGYTYETDEFSRIKSVSGKVHLREREGRLPIKDAMSTIGKGAEQIDDERGHLIGDVLAGSNGLENLVPMDPELNNGSYRKMELMLKKAVEQGHEVYLKIDPLYSDETRRPSHFVATYRIDGETTVEVFNNKRSQDV